MRRPLWRGLGLVPVLALFVLALWWGRPAQLLVPATITWQATMASSQVAATPGTTPIASPSPVSTPAVLPEDLTFRGSGEGRTAPVRLEREPAVVVVAYHGDGHLIVWLEPPVGERRLLVDEIGPWDGDVEVMIDPPGAYRFAVVAAGGPWTITIEGPPGK